jgi:hypothetical protein
MRSMSMTGIIMLLPISGCVVKTIDVLPGVPLRITHPTVTVDPDVRQNGKWIPSQGKVVIEPGELVAVPMAPR